MSSFWKELLKLSGTSLKFSTTYHPQSDGQTEVMNRGLEQYLRAFTHDRPKRWSHFLPWAELALNSSFHEGLRTSPFRVLYGRDPPELFHTRTIRSSIPSVEELLKERVEVLHEIKGHLAKMQQRLRDSANKHRRDVSFAIGDLVLIKLHPRRQHSLARPVSTKLSQRFYGPFQVLERIGEVAYRLQFPDGVSIHNVFHVSLLRPFVPGPTQPKTMPLPTVFLNGSPVATPLLASARRTIFLNGEPQEQWLVHWDDSSIDATTWEPKDELLLRFPTLSLEDKAVDVPGGVDTGGSITTPLNPMHTSTTLTNSPTNPTTDPPHHSQTSTTSTISPTTSTTAPPHPSTANCPTTSKSRPRRKVQPPSRFQDFI